MVAEGREEEEENETERKEKSDAYVLNMANSHDTGTRRV